ncbi:DNA alkylation repair protein [Candidatus Babeliales bacterium]|nr:DNA alkylation repair protein [Candidatus Babeliales bacterium]
MTIADRIQTILKTLQVHSDAQLLEGMARFGIKTIKAYGVSVPVLRKLACEIGKDHELAQKLWDTKVHEARLLATMVAEADKFTNKELERWLKGLDSWDVCDQACLNVFWKMPDVYNKALLWSSRDEEFIRRAGFALMAVLAVKDKEASDEKFIPFLRAVLLHADDDRNFVKKAVNWALRQVGKRNALLHSRAVSVARELKSAVEKPTRWIGADAMRELQSDAVKQRLNI